MCNAWNHSDGCGCGFSPPYTSDPEDYFERHFGDVPGKDLSGAGPRTKHLATMLHDDKLTTQLASTFLWQSYIGSSSSRVAERPPKPDDPIHSVSIYIVRHGKEWPRHDLLIFDPQIPKGKIIEGQVDVSLQELRNGWHTFRKVYLKGASPPQWLANLDLRDIPKIAIEAMRAQRHFFVAMKPPKIVWTASTQQPSPRIASPAMGVFKRLAGKHLSTAGVIVTDERGRTGVTTALHSIKNHGRGIFVSNSPGTIRSRDTITDSCFIETSDLKLPRVRQCRGTLEDVVPGPREVVWFDGATSGRMETRVIGWTPEVLGEPIPGVQSRIMTTPVTDPGDSGAALVIEKTGVIIGFALYRTGLNAPSPHSAWIWARSVFDALHLH